MPRLAVFHPSCFALPSFRFVWAAHRALGLGSPWKISLPDSGRPSSSRGRLQPVRLAAQLPASVCCACGSTAWQACAPVARTLTAQAVGSTRTMPQCRRRYSEKSNSVPSNRRDVGFRAVHSRGEHPKRKVFLLFNQIRPPYSQRFETTSETGRGSDSIWTNGALRLCGDCPRSTLLPLA